MVTPKPKWTIMPNPMKNYLLQVFLKKREERTMADNITLIRFWSEEKDPQVIKFAWMINNLFNPEGIVIIPKTQ